MSYASAYHYQIRCKDGTVGYVGQCEGKYVFTPLTYDEFPAAMLMAKALNKRTMNEHEVYPVKRRVRVNGRYGSMRSSAIAPVRGGRVYHFRKHTWRRPMTEDERYEKLNDKLDKILDKLSNKLEGVSKSLQNHEVRIVVLETKSPAEKKDWRTDIIQLLVKAVVIGGVGIASLAGAGGLLQKIMGG